jgi:hypothetical protein
MPLLELLFNPLAGDSLNLVAVMFYFFILIIVTETNKNN